MKKSHSTVRLDIDRVRQQIAHHGYKYSALADSVGVSTNAIKNWLSGRTRTIYRKNAVLLATAFHCPIDDILLADTPPRPAPSESQSSPVIASIFDHHIKVFGLVKASVTGYLSARHISEVRSIFSNILTSLDADTENFGHCQIFVFNALHHTLPEKQVAHAIERLSAFERMVGEVEGRFADHDIGFRMLLALSDGNSTPNGLCSVDAYSDNFGKLLEYVDALDALPTGRGVFCSGTFQELASSLSQKKVAFGDQVIPPLQLVQLRLGLGRRGLRPAEGRYVAREKVARACAAAGDYQHIHLYGDMGSGKSSALLRRDGELASFLAGKRTVGPIRGAEHFHEERPAVLALAASYVDNLVKAGKNLPAIKAFIRSKCGDISPVIDSLLLSMLGHEQFSGRERFFDRKAIDKFCYLAIIRIMQLDSRVYPSVLLVDDYDALDPFSRKFVDFFFERLPFLTHTKLLTTGNARFPLLGNSQSTAIRSRSIRLVNFNLAETQYLLHDLKGEASADTIETLYRLTKGHPLLLAEVKQRWWQRDDRQQRGNGRAQQPDPTLPLSLAYQAEPSSSWDSSHHALVEELKAANKPHQTLYFLLSKDLSSVEVEALQIVAVAGFCWIDAALINHLEWTFSSEKKLSEILHQIADKNHIIETRLEGSRKGYRFCHGLFHLAFKLSVPSRARQKIHLVLHSYWEAELAKPQSAAELVYEKLLLHSRGCKLFAEYGRYASRYYDQCLREGKIEGLIAKVDAVIKVLTKATPTSEIKDSLCQLYLLKTKITFLAAGWTHPDILKFLVSCESHDIAGVYQPFVDLMKIYYYAEKGNARKVSELFIGVDDKSLRQHVPIVYVAILCIFSTSTFMAGHLAKCLQTMEDAREIYEDIGNSEAFVAALDLDYGVWIYGSLALASLVAGNNEKSEEYLRKGRALCTEQNHLSTLGCLLLFENMIGVLCDRKDAVRKNSKSYLRKTHALRSAQATIWPFYHWAVGDAGKLLEQVEMLRSAGNKLLCSFFYYLAADVQWQQGDHLAARNTLNQAFALEKQLGQSFVTVLVASKNEIGPAVRQQIGCCPHRAR